MILLNSTIKGKQEVKTASKWKGGEAPPKNFLLTLFIQAGETLPVPRSQCPVEVGLAPTTLLPPIFNCFFCLRLTGPPWWLPLQGSIDSLVNKVKARGANTTPDGTQATRQIVRLHLSQALSLIPFLVDLYVPLGVYSSK